MKNFKIVADSSADLLELQNIPFASAPLKIITAEKEYIDNKDLDVLNMVRELASHKGRSSTSCPNPENWLRAFGDAKYIFCIPITGTLSGSYNAALVAKDLYEELYPDRHVFVVNSLSAGPELKLIIEKISELILSGEDYHTICSKIPEYTKFTSLLFILESMKNLANNGRINPIVAKAAGFLGIRVVGKASEKGDLQSLEKCKGQDKALTFVVKTMIENGLKTGKVRIAHCFNEPAANKLRDMLISENPQLDIEVYETRGLCSFYAEQGGLLIGYEHF